MFDVKVNPMFRNDCREAGVRDEDERSKFYLLWQIAYNRGVHEGESRIINRTQKPQALIIKTGETDG